MARPTAQGHEPHRAPDAIRQRAAEAERQQLAEYYRSFYEQAAIQQIERRLEIERLQLEEHYRAQFEQNAGRHVDRRLEVERLKIEAEFDRNLESVKAEADRRVEIERLKAEAEFDRKLDFVGEEAERQIDAQRAGLEAELQQKLDQVGADVETIEAINARTQRRLKGWLGFCLLLLVGAAGAGGTLYLKRIRPEVQQLRASLSQEVDEKIRLEQKSRDQESSLRQANDKLNAIRMEAEQTRKPPTAAVSASPAATASATPATPAPGSPAMGTQPAAASKVSASRTKQIVHSASTPPSSPPPAINPALSGTKKGGKCKCAQGDPVCGCLN